MRNHKRNQLKLVFLKDSIKLNYFNFAPKIIKKDWLNSKANDLLISSKDNQFSGKSYKDTSYNKKKRYLISLIHTVEVRWKEQHLMSLFRGKILEEECSKFTNNENYYLKVDGLINFIKTDLILKDKCSKFTPL